MINTYWMKHYICFNLKSKRKHFSEHDTTKRGNQHLKCPYRRPVTNICKLLTSIMQLTLRCESWKQ